MLTNERAPMARTDSRGRLTLVLALAIAAIATLTVFLARPAPSRASLVKGTLVTTAKNDLGRILVDGRGRTLYLFEKDKLGASACAASCATYWPPLLTTGKPVAAAGVKTALLGTAKRTDGTLQVTYKGHPLYTFKLDAKPGQAKGEGTDFFGAEWYVLATSGTKVEKPHASGSSTSSSAAASSNGNGYGY
jgi:predicted lipoprotein with Yx(FWY)xxD motif